MTARIACRAVAGAFALLATFSALAPVADAGRSDRVVFSIQPSEIDESSSLVVSAADPGLVYTANDSGGSATVYVLDSKTGALVGATSIAGVDPIDIEAMAAGSDGSLVVADIGDNHGDHTDVTAYRIDQPGRGDKTVDADSVTMTYSDGPRDAESALYDADSGRLFVVSKQFAGAHVYRSPPNVFSHDHVVLHRVTSAPRLATDATFLPGGEVAVIRTYFAVYFYTFPGWHRLASMDLPLEPQGESLAAPGDGAVLWIGSEGEHSKVLQVDVPDLTPPVPPTSSGPSTSAPPTSPAQQQAEADNEHREQLKSRAIVVGGIALGLLVIVTAVVIVRYRRHPTEP